MDNYSKFIAASRYARWQDADSRRETWEETAQRYVNFFKDRNQINDKQANEIKEAIVNLEVMPSMRCVMTAGPALDRDNVAGFNCSYLPIDHPKAFDELMYILMCGTGVGFSVERQYIAKLPDVAEKLHPTGTTIDVADSKIGWAKAMRQLVAMLYAGEVPSWDVTKVRAAGERLKIFGGRASGPQPLVDLFQYTVEVFKRAAGRKLNSLECHDLCCKIAEVIVVGGVRRSALISLSNPSDGRLRNAKSGHWWEEQGQRALANNSACYTEKPEFNFFMDEMKALYDSKSGERGIFSRIAAQKIAARNERREAFHDFGTNPCSEIILRPNQFCNLSEVVVRANDTLDSLKEKVRIAAILGTLQATLTDFRYLRAIWKKNTEEEALLGVSLTGIMDAKITSSGKDLDMVLNTLREVAIETNKKWADILGVKQAAAITCVKPSGTVSQLVNSASGIHPRFSPYYIRTVRADSKDPMAQYMLQAGFPCEVDSTKVTRKPSVDGSRVHLKPTEQDLYHGTTLVFSFPVKSPKGAVYTTDMGALEQLKLWKIYQDNWCEHKPSITVYYKDDEFFDICSWMWKNFDMMSGISLLPYSDHTYDQAPYTECTEAQYSAVLKIMPEFDWEALSAFEFEDMTTGSQELACVGGMCEI
jgi:ribonucleoside-triphosphate reductase (thioredoxin)